MAQSQEPTLEQLAQAVNDLADFRTKAQDLSLSIVAHVGSGKHETRVVAVAALAFAFTVISQIRDVGEPDETERHYYERVLKSLQLTARRCYGCTLESQFLQ